MLTVCSVVLTLAADLLRAGPEPIAATLRSKGIDHFEERELIEIGVAGANSPDAVFTQFPDSFATPLASLAQLAKIIRQRSCSYETISIGKLKPSCSLRFKR
jgi:hypothetical protein